MAYAKPHFKNQNVRPKKHFGQHFLKDESIAEKIADALNYDAFSKLIEIGPGTGMLRNFYFKKTLKFLLLKLIVNLLLI